MISPFYDSTTLVSSYIAGQRNLYPGVFFQCKPLLPTDCEILHREMIQLREKAREQQDYIVKKLSEIVVGVAWEGQELRSLSADEWSKVLHILRLNIFLVAIRISGGDDIPDAYAEYAKATSPEDIEKK